MAEPRNISFCLFVFVSRVEWRATRFGKREKVEVWVKSEGLGEEARFVPNSVFGTQTVTSKTDFTCQKSNKLSNRYVMAVPGQNNGNKKQS